MGQGLREQPVRRDHACGDRSSMSSLTAIWNWVNEETGLMPVVVRGSERPLCPRGGRCVHIRVAGANTVAQCVTTGGR